jgi:membrane protein implicated in regulation of membrane protease activity
MSQNQKKPGDTLLGFGAALIVIGVVFFIALGASVVSWIALVVGVVLLVVALVQKRGTSTEG